MALSNTKFKGVNQAGECLLSDQLEANVVSFVQWACLSVGGFFNVTIPTVDYYGGNDHILAPREDPNYVDGQVWEGFRKDWVFESGVDYSYQPIAISGVWVNGSFHSNAETGVYAHTIDYPNGRVIFNSPLSPTGDHVQCEYSYRMHHFTTADVDWWRTYQANSMRAEDTHFQQFGSGSYDVLAQNRVQLPAIIIEAEPSTKRWGKELGSLIQVTNQEVSLYVVAQDRTQMKWLHDALASQKELTLLGFDKNQVMDSGMFPLDAQGGINPSGLMYPDLCQKFGWRKLYIFDTSSNPLPLEPPIHSCRVRWLMQVDTP